MKRIVLFSCNSVWLTFISRQVEYSASPAEISTGLTTQKQSANCICLKVGVHENVAKSDLDLVENAKLPENL